MPGKITDEIGVRAKLINEARKKQYVGLIRNAANAKVVAAKQSMLREFDEHEVTKELLQDPSKPGSKFINYGNLVSLIGFSDASVEVGIIRDELNYKTELSEEPFNITNSKNKIYYEFSIFTPTLKELKDETAGHVEKYSGSWITLIENGVSNAVRYLFSSLGLPNSKSGFGLQTKKDREQAIAHNTDFTGVKYLSTILDNFRKRFK